MKTTKNILYGLFLLLCALLVVASVSNVLLDNAEVLEMAQSAACGGKKTCDLYKVSVLRLPIWQTVSFTNGRQSIDVRCTRSAIAFGAYSCEGRPAGR